jgi:DNA-binding protein YbaB
MDQGRPRLDPVVDHQRFRSGLAEVRDQLPELRQTQESEDGLVTVTVGAGGELLALELDPRIYRAPDTAALAANIIGTVQLAAAEVRERVHHLTRSLLSDAGRADPLLARFDRAARR